MKPSLHSLLALGLFASALLPGHAQEAAKATSSTTQKLELLGITFQVTSPNTAAANTVTVTPSGLKGDNRPQTSDVKGTVVKSEVADLNVDGSPELYIYLRSADGTGSLLAYSANRKKSLSQITMPELADVKKNTVGYRGGDEFAVVEGTLVRRFPIYSTDASDPKPTGRTRQLQYKLKAGEAGWLLKLDKSLEY